jgi:hypothetical protein
LPRGESGVEDGSTKGLVVFCSSPLIRGHSCSITSHSRSKDFNTDEHRFPEMGTDRVNGSGPSLFAPVPFLSIRINLRPIRGHLRSVLQDSRAQDFDAD